MGKFKFFEVLKSLFGKKTETKSCCQHDVVEPTAIETPVETTEVEKITERMIDVSTKPLTEVKPENSVKEIKSKSRKKVVPEETKAESKKAEKPKAEPTKKVSKKSSKKK